MSKKLITILIVLGVIIWIYPNPAMAQSGPRKVEDKGNLSVLSTTAPAIESSRSILLGGTVAYTDIDNGAAIYDFVTGFSQPVGSRLYLTGVGKISEDSQYGVEVRSNYFLRPPSSGVNFFLVSGVGVDWRETALMTSTAGFGAMIPGEYTSPWAMFYIEQVAKTKEIGLTIGILIMP